VDDYKPLGCYKSFRSDFGKEKENRTMDEEKKEVTSHILRYILPDDYSEAEKEAQPIDAEEIVEAIKDGKAVEIINAVIEGHFILNSVNVKSNVTIQRTKIRGSVDWSYAAFKQVLHLENSIFETDATFTATTIDKDIFLDNATFLGIAALSDITVTGVFYCRSTIFKKEVTFLGAIFKKRLHFDNSTFEGETNFVSARIGGNAVFTGTEFKEPVRFRGAQIEGAALFNQATFEGETNFVSARIGSNAVFTGTEFKEQANFSGAQIEESVFFSQATFEGEADFVIARIGSNAAFNGATFKKQVSFGSARIGGNAMFTGAKFKELATFNGAQIEESVFFNPATFEGDADFVSVRIGGNAVFNEAKFKEQANFSGTQIEESVFFNRATFEDEVEFVIARIGGNAMFTGAKFKEQANFSGTQIKGDGQFKGTIFANDVSFQNTSLRTVFFGEPDVQLHAKIDLRGCIYDRIHPISFWEQLMECLDPYDRQPFTQLEETFRRAGNDKLADDVHYKRKCRESSENITIQMLGTWLLDRFLYRLTGYGVRLRRLLWAIIPILIIGTFIFCLEGAVKLDIQPHFMLGSQATLHWCDAFWVSLNTFLPVEIPSGADWKPSAQIIPVLGIKFTTFATLLDLAGWILVPVAVAGISGLLKRSK
jgi:uncharacterized protein YjbI with pentapeptide repeats